jgi:hypothetical protein
VRRRERVRRRFRDGKGDILRKEGEKGGKGL